VYPADYWQSPLYAEARGARLRPLPISAVLMAYRGLLRVGPKPAPGLVRVCQPGRFGPAAASLVSL